MSNEIVSSAPADLELQGVSNDDLRAMIRDAVGMTESAIVRLASLWREATRRGIDLSDIRFAMAPVLHLVANSRLLPALVVGLAGQTRALQRLADLPLGEQDRLARGGEVAVWQPTVGAAKNKRLDEMTFPEISAVVRNGRLASVDEQRAAIAAKPMRMPRTSRVVNVRLAPDTYHDAERAARARGQHMEDYLRLVIIEALRAATSADAP